jgi:hypothetical protein
MSDNAATTIASYRYALYPPAEAGLPWLAVVLDGAKPVDMFGCSDRENAERLLEELQARWRAKGHPAAVVIDNPSS